MTPPVARKRAPTDGIFPGKHFNNPSTMRCILDLGIQKTGSKARQAFFARELGRLVDCRASYPASGRVGLWHRPLYEALARGDDALARAAADEAARRGTDLVILSYEEMHKLDAPAIERLLRVFPRLDAVVFLRRQDAFVNSFYNQLHKSHRVRLETLSDFESRLAAYDPHLDYRLMLDRWAELIGADRLHPVVFDKASSPVETFFAAAGIRLDLTAYHQPPHANPAIDKEGLAVLRAVKGLVGDASDLFEVMTVAHGELAHHFTDGVTTEVDLLDSDTRARIMAHYDDANEWVRRRYFPKQRRLFNESQAPRRQGALPFDKLVAEARAAEIIALSRSADVAE